MRRLGVAVGGVVLALATAQPAAAAYRPDVQISLSTTAAGAAPAIRSVLTVPDGDDTTATIEARFPLQFSYNPAFSVPRCKAADEKAGTCPPGTALGRLDVTTAFGDAGGQVSLTEDMRLTADLQAYGGLIRTRVSGRIAPLDDGTYALRFDGLPQIPVRTATIALQGGTRGLLVNPWQCGGYTISTRFTSHGGTSVEKVIPVTVGGCPAELRIDAAAAIVRGRRVLVRWTLPLPATYTEVVVYRWAGMWEPARVLRGPGGSGPVTTRLRLAPGRYRAGLRARGLNGAVSPERLVAFDVR